MAVNEPTTLLTDYLLAALAFVLARRLSRSRWLPSVSRLLWAASFLAIAVAALFGGTWHGIPPTAVPALRYHLWSITYVTIGIADCLILAGAARATLPRGPRAAALALLTGRFLVYAALILGQRGFRYVGYDYLVTLLLLLVFGFDLRRRGEPAAAFVLGGALVSLAGGLIEALHVRLHPQFNENDLFHVVQMVGIWLFYLGGLRLRDAPDCVPPAANRYRNAATASPTCGPLPDGS